MYRCLYILVLILATTIDVKAQLLEELLVNVHSVDSPTMLATTPALEGGHLIYNTDAEMIHVWSGTEWISLEVITRLEQNLTNGNIYYDNETGTRDSVVIRSADPGNNLVLGTDGGLFINSTANVFHGFLIIDRTGTISVTDIPFEPSQISFVAHCNVETLDLNSDNGTRNNDGSFQNSFGTMNGFARQEAGGAITQQVIYVGGSGNSINDISRFASSTDCIGLRYSNQNGDNLGFVRASLSSFDPNGFTLNVSERIENVVVLYTAYN